MIAHQGEKKGNSLQPQEEIFFFERFKKRFPRLTDRINHLQQKTTRNFMPCLVQMQELAVHDTALSLFV